MALKTSNKNRKKPSVVESKVELKTVNDVKNFKEENYFNNEFFDNKINYKKFFGFLALFAVVAFFVV